MRPLDPITRALLETPPGEYPRRRRTTLPVPHSLGAEMFVFMIAKFDGAKFGERICPYSLPANQLVANMAEAVERAMFSFTDEGICVEITSECDFTTDDGEDYRVFLEPV